MSEPHRARIFWTYCSAGLRVKKTGHIQEPQSVRAWFKPFKGRVQAPLLLVAGLLQIGPRLLGVLLSSFQAQSHQSHRHSAANSQNHPKVLSLSPKSFSNSWTSSGKATWQDITRHRHRVQGGQKMSTGLSLNPGLNGINVTTAIFVVVLEHLLQFGHPKAIKRFYLSSLLRASRLEISVEEKPALWTTT